MGSEAQSGEKIHEVISNETGHRIVSAIVGNFSFGLQDVFASAEFRVPFFATVLAKPVVSGETGLCVNAEVLPVSESENLFVHHSPSPTGATGGNFTIATVNQGGTACTFVYFALSLGFANSIVPFVL